MVVAATNNLAALAVSTAKFYWGACTASVRQILREGSRHGTRIRMWLCHAPAPPAGNRQSSPVGARGVTPIDPVLPPVTRVKMRVKQSSANLVPVKRLLGQDQKMRMHRIWYTTAAAV